MDEKIKFLQKCYLFRDLEEKDLAFIVAQVKEKTLAKDTLFIQEELPGDEMYLITEGLVKVFRLAEDGKEMTVALKGKGDIVGELSLLDNEHRAANAQTLKQTDLLVLRREDFLTALPQHPTIAINMLKNLAKIVRESNNYIEGLISQSLVERTERTLQMIGEHFPDRTITMSHEELSLLIGVTRPRVTEALHALEKAGKVTLAHKSIRLV